MELEAEGNRGDEKGGSAISGRRQKTGEGAQLLEGDKRRRTGKAWGAKTESKGKTKERQAWTGEEDEG